VEDVLQETFIGVWRGAKTYSSGGGEVGAWIWGIARRQAALWARKAGGMDEGAQTLDALTTGDFTSTAATRIDLARAIAGLGPEGDEARQLAHLVFVEDRSLAEIAGRLGIPEGTVKSRIFKLRRRLQAALQQGED
jgi:RNA polymerase sigma-70 factor (ECF subfamily)